MKFINFNIRYGGQDRTPEIIKYLIKNDFDLIILTEFIMNDCGKEIIQKLTEKGYKTQSSNEIKDYGSFIASKKEFTIKKLDDRWAEIYIPEIDLYVLGVYVPDRSGAYKTSFWNKILEYAEKNSQKNVLISGDFNSNTNEDSANETEYYAQYLRKLEDLGFIDVWKYYSKDRSDRYTWFHHSGVGFRLDYAFVSPKLAASLEGVSTFHDSNLRISKVSDHSALCINWKKN